MPIKLTLHIGLGNTEKKIQLHAPHLNIEQYTEVTWNWKSSDINLMWINVILISVE